MLSTACLRFATISVLFGTVHFWAVSDLKWLGYVAICLTSISAGAITTATFTMMMALSQKAPEDILATHYSLLATCEVLGKLIFAALAGWLIDTFGLSLVFALFSILAFLVIPFICIAPNSVMEKHCD